MSSASHPAISDSGLPASAAPASIITDADLPLQRIYQWEKVRADRVFLTQPLNGGVREWTWAQAMNEARRVAAWIEAQNWPKESHVVILAKNSAWWIMAEFAIWMAGHVSVPIFPSLKSESVHALIEHADAVACFVGAVDDLSIHSSGIPRSVIRIALPNARETAEASWDSIVESTAPLMDSPTRQADELATIMYSSGTTGAPKGVMHRFAAFAYFGLAVTRVVGNAGEDRMLSYLPLAHIAERALLEGTAINCGIHLYFVDKLDTFRADLYRARPTIFFSVPRLLLKFQHGVFEKIPKHKLETLLRIPVVGGVVRRRVLRQLGLDHVRLAASGSAALPLSVLDWYRRLGLNLVEGYGMTETGISHTPLKGRSRPGFVGDGIPGVETKIAANGEVLIRSRMNMMGYYKNFDLTKSSFTEDGFFRTGDMGELDEGWLRITGRIKEQFKTSKGKYILPGHIEKLLSVHPSVQSCCVMGEGMAAAFALIVVSPEALESPEPLERSLRELLDNVNRQLEAHERLGFLVATDEPWTVANDMLTPTLKHKRSALERRYSPWFEAWVGQKRTIVWHTTQNHRTF